MECSKTTKEEYFPDYSSSRFGILHKSKRDDITDDITKAMGFNPSERSIKNVKPDRMTLSKI